MRRGTAADLLSGCPGFPRGPGCCRYLSRPLKGGFGPGAGCGAVGVSDAASASCLKCIVKLANVLVKPELEQRYRSPLTPPSRRYRAYRAARSTTRPLCPSVWRSIKGRKPALHMEHEHVNSTRRLNFYWATSAAGFLPKAATNKNIKMNVLSSYCLFHISTLYFLFYLTYSKDFGDDQAVASQRDDGNGKYLLNSATCLVLPFPCLDDLGTRACHGGYAPNFNIGICSGADDLYCLTYTNKIASTTPFSASAQAAQEQYTDKSSHAKYGLNIISAQQLLFKNYTQRTAAEPLELYN
ncbi:hypothetical protein Anapl_09936 [Anas platyrhynchos]|uniref:Uncharacterized protein n=1 Tax=Anas platyrhynchos TaxID=8839 RepID=R0LTG8_ANAPL|nr:hypothetical protein Anapl_09936 [Anas platyrhynchos]